MRTAAPSAASAILAFERLDTASALFGDHFIAAAVEKADDAAHSNGKTRAQSSFMLATVQLFIAAAFNALSSRPI